MRTLPACLLTALALAIHVNAQDFPNLEENAPDASVEFALLEKAGLYPIPPNARPILHIAMSDKKTFRPIRREPPGIFKGWCWEVNGALELLYGNRLWEGPVHLSSASPRPGDRMEGAIVGLTDPLAIAGPKFELLSKYRDAGRVGVLPGVEVGSHLLLAARLHQIGHKREANQLAAYLFASNGKEPSMQAALSAIRDLDYFDLFGDYLNHGDLGALAAGVEAMIASHRGAWFSAPVAGEELALWRASLQAEPRPTTHFNPDQLILVDRFRAEYDMSLNHLYTGQGKWLLRPRSLAMEQAHSGTRVTEESLRVIDAFWNLGLEALPVFLALSEDPGFVPRIDDGRGISQIRVSSREERERVGLRHVFLRPTRISTLAESWLLSALPGKRVQKSGEDLRADASRFYEENKGKTRLELAHVYLEAAAGYKNLDPDTLFTLLASGDPDVLASYRADILNRIQGKERLDFTELPTITTLFDGVEGEGFRQKLATGLRERFAEELATEGSGWGRTIREVLKDLEKTNDAEEKKAPPGLDFLVDSLLKGEMPDESILPSLLPLMGDPIALQKGILSRIGEADTLEQRKLLIGVTLGTLEEAKHFRMERKASEGPTSRFAHYLNPGESPVHGLGRPDAESPVLRAIPLIPDLWLPLLGDEDRETAEMIAARILVLQSSDQDTLRITKNLHADQATFHDAGLGALLRSLAQRILKGETSDWVAELPHGGKVPEARAKAMAAILRGTHVADALSVLNTKDPNETIWIREHLGMPPVRNNQALWDAIAEERRTVQYLSGDAVRLLGEFAPKTGTRLTEADVLGLLRLVQGKARQGQSGSLVIRESLVRPGLVLGTLGGDSFGSAPRTGEVTVILESRETSTRLYTLEGEMRLEEPPAPGKALPEKTGHPLPEVNPMDFGDHVRGWLAATSLPHGNANALYMIFKANKP